MNTKIIYQDIPLSFKAHPVTGNVVTLKDKAAISQSIKNLVLTNKFEILFNPNIFTDVRNSVFDLFGEIEFQFLKMNIENIIKNYEPRARLVDVKYRNDFDSNSMNISIYYIPQNDVNTTQIDLFFEKVR
jgi:phage baseplate assembly protein W